MNAPLFPVESKALERVIFQIPGQPVAKGRPRFRNVHTKAGHDFTATYTPAKTRNYENLVKLAAAEAMAGRAPLQSPLYLRVTIGLEIPASWSKRKQEKAAAGDVRATKKPDADNVLKSIKDGANGVVWRDDSQVVTVLLSKRYMLTPGVSVIVSEVSGECA